MLESDNASLVYGEAPESDEEIVEDPNTVSEVKSTGDKPNTNQLITSDAICDDAPIQQDLEIGKPKRILIMGKKLEQKNRSVRDNLITFKKQLLIGANHDLIQINQKLLKTQIELQQSLMLLKASNDNLAELHNKLKDIVAARYIPPIHISGIHPQIL